MGRWWIKEWGIQDIQWINGSVLWNLFSLSLPLLPRYKSNEEYVYVRGRGRGKYICGECGIRCKKPSMLKKHIRSHTDVRPYICKHCNFAFKTKGGWRKWRERLVSARLCSVIASVCLTGSRRASIFRLLCLVFSGNLTKHMKSKAHGKKCQAMGVSESSLDDPESEETGTREWAGQTFHIFAPPTLPHALLRILVHSCMNCLLRLGAAPCQQLMQHCSILLPLALHKKCEKAINKEHGGFDIFLQECTLFSRVHSIFSFLLFEASYLTGFSPMLPFDSQTHHLLLDDKRPVPRFWNNPPFSWSFETLYEHSRGAV